MEMSAFDGVLIGAILTLFVFWLGQKTVANFLIMIAVAVVLIIMACFAGWNTALPLPKKSPPSATVDTEITPPVSDNRSDTGTIITVVPENPKNENRPVDENKKDSKNKSESGFLKKTLTILKRILIVIIGIFGPGMPLLFSMGMCGSENWSKINGGCLIWTLYSAAAVGLFLLGIVLMGKYIQFVGEIWS